MLTGLIAAIVSTNALAQPDPSGIDFVTIGSPGNPAYAGPDVNQTVTGRGSVPYEYRLGRTEVTTSQWMEFYEAFAGRAPHLTAPVRWGAVDRGASQSPRFALNSSIPDAGLLPVSGPSLRTAAMFCNWLHNDKRTDLSAVMNGAYDVSTFGYTGPSGNIFTDQAAHHPDARYWIPTLDEWIKGGFYDPNYGGTNIGGWWWNTPAGTNEPLIHGPPGVGQANSAFSLPDDAHYRIALGSYPTVQSPWGLLDMAGATAEFSETINTVDGIRYRDVMGSHWSRFDVGVDSIPRVGGDFPSLPDINYGLRIASAVPAPGAWLVAVAAGAWCLRRRRDPAPRLRHHSSLTTFGLVSLALANSALAQPDPSGIDFVTIGAPGNSAYSGPDNNNAVTGRGSVPYEYRLGRTEVTTSQWMEFYNAFYGRVPFLTAPVIWGGVDRGPGQSPRFVLSNAPGAADFPVAGPSWRTAAMFCNWLHNDKRTDVEAAMNGAYDARTFGYNGQIFTDQAAHHPDARYWIPTLDEWIKGSYYDPNYGGLGIGGWWWRSVNGSNTPLIYGPPGQGQANADFNLPGDGQFRIPLGSYPETVSPWGLLDVAGATREHLETVRYSGGIPYRQFKGSHWTTSDGAGDVIYRIGADFPSPPDIFTGFRIAASIPTPSVYLGVFLGLGALSARRPSRR